MRCPRCGYTINPAALMAKRRARSLTKKERQEIGRNAVMARWNKAKSRKK